MFDWESAPPCLEEVTFNKALLSEVREGFLASGSPSANAFDESSLITLTDLSWRVTRALWVWKDSRGPELVSRRVFAEETKALHAPRLRCFTDAQGQTLDEILENPEATSTLQQVWRSFVTKASQQQSATETLDIALQFVPVLQAEMLSITSQVSMTAKTQLLALTAIAQVREHSQMQLAYQYGWPLNALLDSPQDFSARSRLFSSADQKAYPGQKPRLLLARTAEEARASIDELRADLVQRRLVERRELDCRERPWSEDESRAIRTAMLGCLGTIAEMGRGGNDDTETVTRALERFGDMARGMSRLCLYAMSPAEHLPSENRLAFKEDEKP